MKKAGIILGTVFIVAAIVIFGISRIVEQNRLEKQQNPIEEVQKPDVAVVVESIQKELVEKPIIVSKPENKVTTSVKELNDSILSEQGIEKEEIVVITSKNLLLIDEAVGEKHGKSIAYVFNVMTDSNKVLKLYITETVYKQFSVGEKLKVNYKLIKNDVGTEFTLVQKVTTTE